MGKISGAESIQ